MTTKRLTRKQAAAKTAAILAEFAPDRFCDRHIFSRVTRGQNVFQACRFCLRILKPKQPCPLDGTATPESPNA